MTEYRVSWSITIDDDDEAGGRLSMRALAESAADVIALCDPSKSVYEITAADGSGTTTIIDLETDEVEGEDEPCEWFVNNATTPSWCCNTHMYDGTGDFPATGEHPEHCQFSEADR
jgi:hypothetical protein